MATADFNSKVSDFSNDNYVFKDGVERSSVVDHLLMRQTQLRSLTLTLYGNHPEEGFLSFSDHVKDGVLWLVDNLVEEIAALVNKLFEMEETSPEQSSVDTDKGSNHG